MSEFSELLHRLRSEAGVSQADIAAHLRVSRPSATQWESGRHLPGVPNVEKIDEFLRAGGALIAAAAATRRKPPRAVPRPVLPPAQQHTAPGVSLAEIYAGVGDRLRDSVQVDGASVGWCRLLNRPKPPSPWSTAIGLRTLQMLDRADVDLYAMAEWMAGRQVAGGWADHRSGAPRPEVTIVVLDALCRLGRGGPDLDGSWAWLDRHFSVDDAGNRDRERPFVVSTVLDGAARVRPDAALVERLTDLLLSLRTGRVWTARPTVPRAAPSLAHTARAVNALRSALPVLPPSIGDRAAEAVREALAAIVATTTRYDGVSLPEGGTDGAARVNISHFTSAHVLRALAGAPESALAAEKRETLLNTFWEAYLPEERAWSWRIEGDMPVWMTLDAVIALRDAIAAGQAVGPVPALPTLNDEEDTP